MILLRMSLMGAYRAYAITDLILDRLVGDVISDVEALLLNGLNGTRLILTDALLDYSTDLRVTLNVARGLARRLYGTEYVIDLLRHVALMDLYGLEVALTIYLTDRYGVRACLTALAYGIVLRALSGLLVSTVLVYLARGICDDRYRVVVRYVFRLLRLTN